VSNCVILVAGSENGATIIGGDGIEGDGQGCGRLSETVTDGELTVIDGGGTIDNKLWLTGILLARRRLGQLLLLFRLESIFDRRLRDRPPNTQSLFSSATLLYNYTPHHATLRHKYQLSDSAQSSQCKC
jgi:hypothetical protein